MACSRFVFFAIIALSVLLAGVESTKMVSEDSIWSSNKEGSLCCNDHPKFGECTKDSSCSSWCREGCDNGKGGFCKKKLCHCYC
ncbi:hypothetical protein Bca52824_089775 [Brassica carinata]|uniref:Uncharacterized protein n=1 Tax=Brassica carinata TaxID=52824 RepID=A0A8X7NSU2_BRACI|nr:hypothetical protein Bca52824_089775 [Brassica carinata]